MENRVYKTPHSREALIQFEDAALAGFPYPIASQFVPTCMGDTHVVTTGDGEREKPALVLLHGAASNLLTFGGYLPAFAADWFVVAVDIVGECGKSAPNRPDWNGDGYEHWLADVLDGLGIQSAALFGQSLGGWIALRFAAAYPARVNALALLSPAGLSPAKLSMVVKTVCYTMDKKNGLEKMKRLVFGSSAVPDFVSAFFELIQAHYVPRIGSPPLLSDAQLRAIVSPILLVFGEQDAFFDAKRAARRLASVVPASRIESIAQGQHGIMDVTTLVADFLTLNSTSTEMAQA